jgi:glycosyltransferase involved in cell wall biosynthesis
VHSPFAAEIATRSGISVDSLELVDNFTFDCGPRPTLASNSDEVVGVGRLSWEKGFDRIVRAWSESKTELRLTIVGEGPAKAELEGLAPSNVRFIGRLSSSEINALMLNARALFLPSRWFESQPMVVLEALAAGLPPIVSDTPPLRWTLGNMSDDLLIPNSPGSWNGAIKLVQSDSFVDEQSTASRSLFLRRFSPAVALQRLTEVYETARIRHRHH